MASKTELLKQLISLIGDDIRKVAPSSSNLEKVVVVATRIVWLLNTLIVGVITIGILTS